MAKVTGLKDGTAKPKVKMSAEVPSYQRITVLLNYFLEPSAYASLAEAVNSTDMPAYMCYEQALLQWANKRLPKDKQIAEPDWAAVREAALAKRKESATKAAKTARQRSAKASAYDFIQNFLQENPKATPAEVTAAMKKATQEAEEAVAAKQAEKSDS
jgi:hypothetical protein